jgi:hypothetical protein
MLTTSSVPPLLLPLYSSALIACRSRRLHTVQYVLIAWEGIAHLNPCKAAAQPPPHPAPWLLLLQLTGLTRLVGLDLSSNRFGEAIQRTPDVFAPLASLGGLRELYLESCLGSGGVGCVELGLTGLEVGSSKT